MNSTVFSFQIHFQTNINFYARSPIDTQVLHTVNACEWHTTINMARLTPKSIFTCVCVITNDTLKHGNSCCDQFRSESKETACRRDREHARTINRFINQLPETTEIVWLSDGKTVFMIRRWNCLPRNVLFQLRQILGWNFSFHQVWLKTGGKFFGLRRRSSVDCLKIEIWLHFWTKIN